jgi:hypothetical protein
MSDEDGDKFKGDWMRVYPSGGFAPEDDQTQLFDGKTTRSFSEIAKQLGSTNELENDLTQLTDGAVVGGWVSLDGSNRYAFEGYSITVPITRTTQTMTISAVHDGPKLLLTNGDGLDFVLWDTTLQGYTIEDDGSVKLAPGAIQKRLITTISAPVHQ